MTYEGLQGNRCQNNFIESLTGMDVGFDQAQVPLGDTTNNYDAHMNFLGM